MLKRMGSNKENSKKDRLPENRKDQFLLLLKNNYMKMVIFSMIAFVFVIPIIVLFIVMNYQTSLLLQEDGANKGNVIFSACLSFSLYVLPLIALLGLGFAGLFSIMKGFVYNEPVFYSSFFIGIKKNYKQFLFIAYFTYLFFVLFLLTFARFYYFSIGPSILRYALISLSAIVFFVVLIMAQYMCTAAVRYESSFKQLLANAFKLVFHKCYFNLLIAVLSVAPWLIAIFFNVIIQMIVFLFMFVYLLSFFALLLTSYHASIYDEFVNKDKFPSIYRAGLEKKSD